MVGGALWLVVTLRKEVKDLKKELKELGVLKEKNESIDK